MKAIIYARHNSFENPEDSFYAQLEDCREYAKKHNIEVVDEYIEYVACGVINMINIFQPDIACIGGGISHEGETLLVPLREKVTLERYSKFCERQTEIVAAVLGNDAGVIGAACLGRQN